MADIHVMRESFLPPKQPPRRHLISIGDLEREVERRRAYERLWVPRRLAAPDVDVVAVEGDVELAERDLGAAQLVDAAAQPLGEWHPARVDPDERDSREVGVPLDDLVRDPRQRLRNRIGVEDRARCRGFRVQRARRQSRRALSWSASQATPWDPLRA
ncbi:MAG TPA: hypothetical protein VJ419_06370 [Gaiellaceae bacterium]|nr:hypothetical protein [Gaiellaceae bacterium]